MFLDSQQAKLFIKVDGVIGDRRRICTFCNNTIHGAEKIVETTRKLRRGPYFPQLAHLQSSVGKIDTMGRAVVCLTCFHQLLRQWNTHEQKNVPMSRRVYKYVADKGVKNYQEARASEIRAEAEKRAFAIYTNQQYIVTKAFDRLTKRLDSQEEIIEQNEECIKKLNQKLALCSKGEEWKINREIRKRRKIISTAEARIEDEEDKEELIRKETKSLLEVYRNNQSLFRAASEPNLHQSCFERQTEKPRVVEDCSDGAVVDNTLEMNKNRREYGYSYNDKRNNAVIKAGTISESLEGTDSFEQGRNDAGSRDLWSPLESSSTSSRGLEQTQPKNFNSDWHLTKEIIYAARSNEVQSFPEDEWSKLIDVEGNDHKDQPESTPIMRSLVTQTRARSPDEDHTEWTQIEDELVGREERLCEETGNTSDSDDDREQVYEVSTSPSLDQDFQTRTTFGDHDVPENTEKIKSGDNESVFEPKHEDNAASEGDPWDTIHMEKEKEKLKKSVFQTRSTTQDLYIRNTTEDDEEDGINENSNEKRYSEKIDEFPMMQRIQDERGMALSPKRLEAARFAEFTKSSYIPKPGKKQLFKQRSSESTSSQQYNGIPKLEVQNDAQIMEGCEERERNTQSKLSIYDPLEPLRKNRNMHERHLSEEEQEWETKHLSPQRLDETKWLNFTNENGENVDMKLTFLESQERKSRFNNSVNSRLSSHSEKLNEVHVERSPASRKLIKQNQLPEDTVYIVTTNSFVEKSPWDDLERSVPSRGTEARHVEKRNENTFDKNVGKIDLKQWNSEVEKNRLFEAKSPVENRIEDTTRSPAPFTKQSSLRMNQESYMDEVVIINKNRSLRKAGDVYTLETKNKRNSPERVVSPAPSLPDESAPVVTLPTCVQHYQENVIIEENHENKPDQASDWLNRRRVGKVNLGPWEQNATTKDNSLITKSSSLYEKSQSIDDKQSTVKVNGANSNRFDNEERSSFKTYDSTGRQSVTNTSQGRNAHSNHCSLNENMSEDELAWEKRFIKSYGRKQSVETQEEEVVQQKVSNERIPRLGDDEYVDKNLNFGKISLDDDEVRRVCKGGNKINDNNNYKRAEDPYVIVKYSVDPIDSEKNQSSTNLNQSHKYFRDTSQLTEEELAWEEKTSRPGRLDFSKFSQFK